MVEFNPALCSKIELFLGARGLKDKDAFSKSDPYCVVSIEGQEKKFIEVGRTHKIDNDLNPNWKETITILYYFEQKQNIRFNVFDYDENSPDDLGFVSTTVGELVARGTSILDLSIGGKIIIRVEEVKTSKDSFMFHMKGLRLDEKDWFGKSDPYLIIYKSLNQNQWAEIHRTEIIKDTVNPMWRPFELSEQQLCNCDRSRPIRVECFDWDLIGSHDMIGIFETSFQEFITRGRQIDLINPSTKKKAGTIEISDVTLIRNLTFIDYLRCGVQLSLSVAIDFTGSNLPPSDPNSLHHYSESQWNQYQKAIWEVGGILQAYDTDKHFPVFGFGGIPRGQDRANHCFPLTGDMSNPYVFGVEGILAAYYRALTEVTLSGPTLFHHLIDQTVTVAASTPPHTMYHVLLILTDGAIMDMPETIASIVRASSMNLSIIIVGVGQAEFGSMEALDCDHGKLRDARGNEVKRDIVQFVPFRHYAGNPAALAAEVLKEVPGQLVQFMKGINFTPILPEEIDMRNIVIQPNPEVHNEVRPEIHAEVLIDVHHEGHH